MKSLLALVIWAPILAASVGAPGPTAWPDHVATHTDLLSASDHASTTLSGAVSSSATTITVASASTFVANQVALINDPGLLEEVKITAISGTTFTVTRGYAGTTAVGHASGVALLGGIGATYHNQLVAELAAFESDRFGHIGSTNGASSTAGPGFTSWPYHAASASDLYTASDFATTALSNGIDATALVLPVADATPFVANQIVTVEREQMKVCSVGTTNLTICTGARGFAGTTASTHATGAPVRSLVSATTFRRLANEISSLEADLFNTYGTGGTATDLAWPNHAATVTELLASCSANIAAACYNHLANEIIALETSVHAGPVPHPTSVVPYSLPSRLGTSGTYTVSVNGTNIPVKNWKSKHWVWFAFSGTASVQVTVSGGVLSYTLSPKRIAPASTTNGSSVSFSLTGGPQKLVLNKVNGGGQPLIILADNLETGAPASSGSGIFNVVTGYGADPSGSGQSTDAIQNAINAANSAGGGTVFIPSGLFKIGPTASRGVQTIVAKSNVTVYLAPGAVLQVPQTVGCCFSSAGVINVFDVSNFTIKGRGIIDGQGQEQGGGFFRLLLSENSSFNLIDCMFLETNNVAIRTGGGNGMNFQNIKVLTDTGSSGGDGIDIESANNITIDHSMVMGSDDSFAIGAGTDERTTVLPMANFTLTHNLLWNLVTGHSLSIVPHISHAGTSKVDQVLFDNNDTIDSQEWVAIYPFGGTVVSNVTISNSSIENIRERPFSIEQVDCTSWGPGNCGTPAGVLGNVTNVNVTNVTWSGYGGVNSNLIQCCGASINHVHFTHFVIGGTTITSTGAMHIDISGSIGDLTFAP